MKQKFKT